MKQQIKALTATRAVAAIMVYIHHYGGGVFPFSKSNHIFQSGNLAVSYFFVLSGFVLYTSHQEKHINYREFMIRRIARIVPLYLFALLLCASLPLLLPIGSVPENITRQFLYSALFLQAFIPNYALILNAPGWSLSVEMFFYVLFPLFMLMKRKNIKVFFLLTVVLFIFSQAVHLWYFPEKDTLSSEKQDLLFFNPLIHINQFLIGMAGGYIYGKLKDKPYKLFFVPTILFSLIMFLIAHRPANVSYHTGLIAPLFMLFILSVALKQDKYLGASAFVFLGEISFGIYILQKPVHDFLSYVNPRYLHITPQYFFYFSLGMLVLFAAICHYFIEKPFRSLINPKEHTTHPPRRSW